MKFLLFIFLLIGGYMLCFGVYSLYCINSAREWVKVPGQIINVKNVITSSKPSTTVPVVKYKYKYKKIFYVNDRLFFGIRISCTDTDCVPDYKQGDNVDVYLNPDNPLESVVNPFEKKSAWIAVVIGCLFLLFAIYAYRFNNKA